MLPGAIEDGRRDLSQDFSIFRGRDIHAADVHGVFRRRQPGADIAGGDDVLSVVAPFKGAAANQLAEAVARSLVTHRHRQRIECESAFLGVHAGLERRDQGAALRQKRIDFCVQRAVNRNVVRQDEDFIVLEIRLGIDDVKLMRRFLQHAVHAAD